MSLHRAFAVGGAIVATPLAVLGAGAASAVTAVPGATGTAALTASPTSVVAGRHVTVSGRCPTVPGETFVGATLGLETLDRYAIVPVANGVFHARVPIAPTATASAPAVGTRLVLRASCRTAASFVASAGSVRLRVVSAATAAASARTARTASAGTTAVAARTPVADPPASSGDRELPFGVPVIALVIAALASFGAYGLGARAQRRDDAKTRHPAYGGVGRGHG